MNKLIFLLGQADFVSHEVTESIAVQGGSIVTKNLEGVCPILPYISSDRTLAAHSTSILVDGGRIRPPAKKSVNLFNLVGDADSSVNRLHNIQTIINATQPIRCFNKPVDVFKTSRTRLPKTLAKVPGCLLPRIEAVNPKTYDDLVKECESFNSWPIILRAVGFHGGEHMTLVSDAAELENIKELPWLYTGILLVEFIDYRNEEGLYQKNRVIMIDGVPYPRHAIISDQWMIHFGNRADLMTKDLDLCRTEERFLATVVSNYNQIFRDIYKRIGLDVFGIDFSVVDGQLLIFEANACMKFLDRKQGGDNRFGYLDDHVRVIKNALKKMLVKS